MGFFKNKDNVYKEYCLIGFNKFNEEIADVLKKEGQKITIIDKDANLINTIEGRFNYAITCDATNLKDLEDLGIQFFDYVIVGITNMEKSVTICSNLMELQVKKIMSKASNLVHARVLKNIGVTKTIIPEIEVAEKIAFQTMYDLNLELFSFDAEITNTFILRLQVNNPNLWMQKIRDIADLQKMSAAVISIKRGNGEIVVPVVGEHMLKKLDHVCLLVPKNSINKIRDYFMKNTVIAK